MRLCLCLCLRLCVCASTSVSVCLCLHGNGLFSFEIFQVSFLTHLRFFFYVFSCLSLLRRWHLFSPLLRLLRFTPLKVPVLVLVVVLAAAEEEEEEEEEGEEEVC